MFVLIFLIFHSGPENLKVQAKKLMKSNKLISRIIFSDQIPFFAISKIDKNQFLNWENFKTAKNAISRKTIFDFI